MEYPVRHLSRRRVLGAIGAGLILPRAALAQASAMASGHAFGTSWRIVANSNAAPPDLGREISRLFARVDRTFSPWRPDSVLSRFNSDRADTPVRNADLAQVTEAALAVARQSDGAFDPTVGPIVGQWGFGPILEGGAPDWRGLSVGTEGIGKSRHDLTLDLCGIAKGWALDRAADLAQSAGITDFLFELGGELVARGRHPEGRDWRVAVDIPQPAGFPAPVLRLPGGTAVATSGIWAQSYDLDGRLYTHIISPGAGSAVAGTLRSVSVISADAMTADGWATALCAAGAEAGPDMAASNGIDALFLVEAAGTLRRVATGSIREFLA